MASKGPHVQTEEKQEVLCLWPGFRQRPGVGPQRLGLFEEAMRISMGMGRTTTMYKDGLGITSHIGHSWT